MNDAVLQRTWSHSAGRVQLYGTVGGATACELSHFVNAFNRNECGIHIKRNHAEIGPTPFNIYSININGLIYPCRSNLLPSKFLSETGK